VETSGTSEQNIHKRNMIPMMNLAHLSLTLASQTMKN